MDAVGTEIKGIRLASGLLACVFVVTVSEVRVVLGCLIQLIGT